MAGGPGGGASAEAVRPRRRGWLRRGARLALAATLALLVLGATLWAAAALAIDGPGRLAGGAYALVALALVAGLRPRRRGLAAWAALFALVLGWWLSLAPSNDRAWLPDVERLARARVDGDVLVVSHVRNFEYRSETDLVPRWEERTYDLARVRGVDLVVCDWGAPGIVHTILSWEFEGGEPLAISIETRKEIGEAYSAIRGFFRQFELYYAVGDERDLLGVRAGLRGERLRLYRIQGTPEHARALLLSYVRRLERLAAEPAWYNAARQNCTTSIRLHAVELGIERPWNWRILVNGRGEELLYLRGMIDTSLPFEELRARSDVTDEVRAALDEPDFSRMIRAGLPPRPGAP